MVAATETCAICGAKPGVVDLVWWFVDGAGRTVHTDCWIAEYERLARIRGAASVADPRNR